MSKKTKIFLICIICLGITSIIINGISLAKYASDSVWNYYLQSKGFYFTSEDLSTSGIVNINSAWTGENIYFSLSNSLNDAVASEVDIGYTVNCTITSNTGGNCKINGTSSNTYSGTLSKYPSCINVSGDGVNVSGYSKTECETAGYEYSFVPTSNELYFTVDGLNDDVTDLTVRISATSNSPYRKTIYGDYRIHRVSGDNEEITSQVNNNNDYSSLVVTNSYNETKCVKVSWNSTNIGIRSNYVDLAYTSDANSFVNSISFNINAKDSVNYDFYARSDALINGNSFTVTESNTCN